MQVKKLVQTWQGFSVLVVFMKKRQNQALHAIKIKLISTSGSERILH